MKTISRIEREVEEIRLKIYEKTKNMTSQEYKEYLERSTEDIVKKYGLKVVKKDDIL